MLAELVLQGSPFLAALHNTRMHRSTRVHNWTFVLVVENNASASHVATNLSSEEALVAPIDTKVSIDTIVQ